MSTLYILIGNIGAGKTTFAKKQAETNPKVKIVSPDSIRQMLNGTYKYTEGLDTIITDICCHAIRDLLLGGYDVVLDACNYTVSRRMPWVLVARSLDCEIVNVFMPCREKEWHVANRMKEPHSSGTDWDAVYDANEKAKEQWDPMEGPIRMISRGYDD